MKRLLSFACVLVAAHGFAQVQPSGDALGMHNLSISSGASVYSQGSLGCTFCHAPHSGIGANTPLWNQKLSTKSYVPYSSTTNPNQGNTQPTLGVTSSLCLSCHDGTVAVGQSAAYGPLPTVGSMNSVDSFGTTLTGSHPFSLVLPMKDAPNLVASLVSQGKTADATGAVKLVNGNIECTSCHDPHIQNIDKIAQKFLVRDSSNAQMCLACHDPNRVVQGQVNQLAGFANSIHQTATNQVSPDAHVGSYATVGVNACTSCHMSHDSVAPARLLRPATPAAPSYDPVTQSCMTCHGGGTYVTRRPPTSWRRSRRSAIRCPRETTFTMRPRPHCSPTTATRLAWIATARMPPIRNCSSRRLPPFVLPRQALPASVRSMASRRSFLRSISMKPVCAVTEPASASSAW